MTQIRVTAGAGDAEDLALVVSAALRASGIRCILVGSQTDDVRVLVGGYDWRDGLTIPCPLCGAGVGCYCDLSENNSATRPSGSTEDNWLHRGRLDAAAARHVWAGPGVVKKLMASQGLSDAPRCPLCTQPATWTESGTRLAGRIYPATCTKCGPIEVKFRRTK